MDKYTKIENQISYIQDILDSQNSIIIIYKNRDIKFVNKRFYDYFKEDSVDSLYEALKLNFDGYSFDEWVERTYNLEEDIKLSLFDENDYTLMASVKKLKDTDEYIITFDVKEIIKTADTILEIVNDILDISTIELEGQKLYGKVLIAEDHLVNQVLIKAFLDLKGDIEKVIVKNGKLALNAYKDGKFDLILMDINMPILSGEDVCKEILEYEKKNGIKHTPIVALIANSMYVDKERCLKIGFDDYLSKPLQGQELDRVLRRYLQKVSSSLNKFLKETNLNKEVYKEIVSLLFENIYNDIFKLEKAVELKDYNNIQDISYKIAGSSGIIRFDDIRVLAKEIQILAKDRKDIDYKEYIQKIKRLLDLYYEKYF